MKFSHYDGGCEIRAHEFALIAKANGIEMGKAHAVYGDGESFGGGLYPKEWKEKKRRGEAIPVADGFMGWFYHVAPFVLVQTEDGPKPYVFDIGIAENMKPLGHWEKDLVSEKDEKARFKTQTRKKIYYDSPDSRMTEESEIHRELKKERLIQQMGFYEYDYWVNEQGLIDLDSDGDT